MTELSRQQCEACRADAPTVSGQEQEALMKQLPEWRIVELDGIKQLQRELRFPDFAQALEFTNQVAALAEDEGHHPALLLEYGRVTVRWWTHKIRGLHHNDFVMAARTDTLYDN